MTTRCGPHLRTQSREVTTRRSCHHGHAPWIVTWVPAPSRTVVGGCRHHAAPRPPLAAWAWWLALSLTVVVAGCRHRAAPTEIVLGEAELQQRLERAQRGLTELSHADAKAALDPIEERRLDVDLLRARLAIALGDCQGASALLASYRADAPPASSASATNTAAHDGEGNRAALTSELSRVAEGCARAMAGAEALQDPARGVWVRFQNVHDHVLMPLIAEVTDSAAKAIGAHLGTALERPIRIEVVSDLPSLAAVTGLPLDAAETTGTIAIARWGKVTIVSPRATREGYPWQDTLAHELTHLLVARKSRDSAPLWLQEGIAKREETRWREPRPFDASLDLHREARQALIEGRSIGLDRIGASMAFLPTPQAAETAYAEVHDFLEYWLKNNGESALRLLLLDMSAGPVRDAERALVSVSGYTLSEWMLRWQRSLIDESRQSAASATPHSNAAAAQPGPRVAVEDPEAALTLARRMRLAALLLERRQYAVVRQFLVPLATTEAKHQPDFVERLAYSHLLLGELDAAKALVEPSLEVRYPTGPWLAVRGRIEQATGNPPGSELSFRMGLALAPTLENVACRGFFPEEFTGSAVEAPLPKAEPWLSLCRAARELNRQ